jgi:hypothetical protein
VKRSRAGAKIATTAGIRRKTRRKKESICIA